jgi:hypothetical protein
MAMRIRFKLLQYQLPAVVTEMTGAMRVTMKREVVAKKMIVVAGDTGIGIVTAETTVVTVMIATKKVDMEEAIEGAVVRFVKTISTTMERQLTRTRCKHSARFTARMAERNSMDLLTQI